ncbi:hypothetical protein HRbin36_02626 [bacterium HR36]|nr:hypothetical protein HRbin36_02626 [bacterium HR36]
MRLLGVALAAVALILVVNLVHAQDKQVTLKGKITCARCELKQANACATVIVVKEGGKEVVYYFDKESHKKHHGEICKEGKEGEVTGTVSKEGDRLVIKVSKVSFK